MLKHDMTVEGFKQSTFEYTINGYSQINENISSETFTVGGHYWKINFFPNVKRENLVYVGFYLELVTKDIDVKALYKFTLLNQTERRMHKVFGNLHCFKTFNRGSRSFRGYSDMQRKSLESSSYLKDDSLSLRCTVGVVNTSITKRFTIVPQASEMNKDIKYLLENETGCDIVFHVKDETFKAHKAILAARSPVFRAQFYGLAGNPTLDEMDLMDIEPFIFKAMLLFIYSDEIPDSEEVLSSLSMSESTHMIQHLLVAADRFGLDYLKLLCEAKLCEEINVDMAATTLSLAQEHHCPDLKAFCMTYVLSNLPAVIETEGYKHVEEKCPLLLSQLLRKIATESVGQEFVLK